MQMGVAPGEADAAAGLAGLSSGGGGDGADAAAGEPCGAASVPYARRLLLKSLLRAIALASYAPGTGARPQARPHCEQGQWKVAYFYPISCAPHLRTYAATIALRVGHPAAGG